MSSTNHAIGQPPPHKDNISHGNDESKRCTSSRKPIIVHSSSPSVSDDWKLFPDNIITKKHSSKSAARSHRSPGEQSPRHLPSSRGNTKVTTQEVTLLHTAQAVSCKDNAQHPITYQGSDPKWIGTEVPSAPSPPRLDTPEVSDVEDNYWSCCRTSQSDVESNALAYIAKTNVIGPARSISGMTDKMTDLADCDR